MEALLGWRSSEGELASAKAMAGLRELGGCCCEEERPRKRENGVRLGAGGRWRDEGALGRGVACAVRATATRGHRRGHAARELCRRSATERVVQFRQNVMAEPDDEICR